MWKIEKIVSKGDYDYAVVKTHPNATSTGYVLAHRIIMENHLKRLLNSNEVVHHIDRNKHNNKISNLVVMSNSDHAKLHSSPNGRKMVRLKCPNCKTIFIRRHGQCFIAKKTGYTCCSNKCRGQFSRGIQLHGRTLEVEKAISENLLEVFINFQDNAEETYGNGVP